MIRLDNISLQLNRKILLQDISTSFIPGEHTVILGPNGAGKSTLLRVAALGIQPTGGTISYPSVDISSQAQLSKVRTFLTQQSMFNSELTVRELVFMGRYPYYHRTPDATDIKIVENALQRFSIKHLSEQKLQFLSGGELQRTHLARVYAQLFTDEQISSIRNKFLFMDEPVNNLDIKHQEELITLATELTENGVGVVSVLHDINMALHTADKLILLKKGLLAGELSPTEITENILEDLYELPFEQTGDLIFSPKRIRSKIYQIF